MGESTGWTPRGGESTEDILARMTDRKTGRLVLRNVSNLFYGRLSAWGMFGLAAVALNRNALSGPDPYAPHELLMYWLGALTISLACELVLARPRVIVVKDNCAVRNPLLVYKFSLADVTSLEPGIFGYTHIVLPSRKIRALGLETSLYQELTTKSGPSAALASEVDRATRPIRGDDEQGSGGSVDTSFQIFDYPLSCLMLAWVVFGLTFLL